MDGHGQENSTRYHLICTTGIMRSRSIPHANTSRRSKYSNRCGRQIARHTVCLLLVTQTDQLEKAHSELEVFVREREHELKERGDMPPLNSLELALSRADRYRNSPDREHFLDGLRKAGLTG